MAFTELEEARVSRLIRHLLVNPTLTLASVNAADDLAVELADGPTSTPAARTSEVRPLEWAAGGNYRQALALLVSSGYGAVDTATRTWPARTTFPPDPYHR